MLATVATNRRRERRHLIGGSGARGAGSAAEATLAGSESVAKGGDESIELRGEVGVEGSKIGVQAEASAGARGVSMDLDRGPLKAEAGLVAIERGCVVRVRDDDDAAGEPRLGERLPRPRDQLTTRELPAFLKLRRALFDFVQEHEH